MRYGNLQVIVGLTLSGMLGLTACTTSSEQTPLATTAEAQASTTLSETNVKGVLPTDLKWASNPNIPGVQNARVVGDSSKPELYVSFGKLQQGTIFPAHTHPDARITTVISGVMYYGVGEEFDQAHVTAYPAGSVVYTPSGVPHIMWAKDGETLVQEAGYGPSGSSFISNGK